MNSPVGFVPAAARADGGGRENPSQLQAAAAARHRGGLSVCYLKAANLILFIGNN